MYTPIPTPAAADFALLVGDAVPEIGEAIAAWGAAADEAYDAIANAEDAADEERTAGARHLAQVREAGRAGAMPQKAPDHHALAEKTAYTAGAADTAIREARAAAKHADAVAQQHAHLAYTVLAERAREAGREATAAAATWQQHRDAAFGALAAAVTAASWAVNGKPSPSGAGSQDIGDLCREIMPPIRPLLAQRDVQAALDEFAGADMIPTDFLAEVDRLAESGAGKRGFVVTHAEAVALRRRQGRLVGF
jgi:hypothetical protein